MRKKLLSISLIFTLCSVIAQDDSMYTLDSNAVNSLGNVELTLSDNNALAESIIADYHAQQDKDFIISPNPAKNTLNIKLPSKTNNLKLEVFDVLGKRIYKGEITQLESSVDVSKWKSGVYLVRISNNEIAHTKRFIKE